MTKLTKKISAAVMAGVMAMSLVVTASAETECKHTTWSAHVRGPYYERTTTHEHQKVYVNEYGDKFYYYPQCTITTTYGQLYQMCQYCGKIMEVRETSLGSTHSVS